MNNEGHLIDCPDSDKLARQLMVLHPIVRIRDARRLHNEPLNNNGNGNGHSHSDKDKDKDKDNSENTRIQRRLENTCERLMTRPGHVSSEEIKSSINALRVLVDHYFAFTPHSRSEHFNRAHFPAKSAVCHQPFGTTHSAPNDQARSTRADGLAQCFYPSTRPCGIKAHLSSYHDPRRP